MKKCLSLIHWGTFHGNVISIDKYDSHFHWDTFHDEVFILYPFINDHKFIFMLLTCVHWDTVYGESVYP